MSNPKSAIQNRKWTSLLPAKTGSPEETRALGARLAEDLEAGEILALYGDLGTGKTQLVKGLGRALGIPERAIRSPTFTIVAEHEGAPFPFYHLDAYRIESPDEFYELGYEDYFFGDGLCVVEWPARIESLLPEKTLRLHLAHLGPNRRRIAWKE